MSQMLMKEKILKTFEQNDDESTSTSSSNPIESFLISVVHLSGVEEVDNFVELINKIDLSKLVRQWKK